MATRGCYGVLGNNDNITHRLRVTATRRWAYPSGSGRCQDRTALAAGVWVDAAGVLLAVDGVKVRWIHVKVGATGDLCRRIHVGQPAYAGAASGYGLNLGPRLRLDFRSVSHNCRPEN